VVQGTPQNDSFDVTRTTVRLNGQLAVTHNLTSGEVVSLVAATSDVDAVTYTGQGPNVTLDLGGRTFVETGFATVGYSDFQTLRLNAVAGAIQIDGSAAGDTFDVTPTGANTADIVMNGAAPVVTANNTGALNIRDANGGSDTIIVHATSGNDLIAVTSSAIGISGRKAIAYTAANIEAITVQAGPGSPAEHVVEVNRGQVPGSSRSGRRCNRPRCPRRSRAGGHRGRPRPA